MTIFQLFGVALSLFLVGLVVSARIRRRITFVASVAWAGLWLLAGVAIGFPGITVAVARVMGIDRGADLVFYCAILSALVGFFLIFLRLRRMEENITVLVRHLAIDQAERGAPGRDEPTRAADRPTE